jgi:ABC-type tungstate transport system permease subunit
VFIMQTWQKLLIVALSNDRSHRVLWYTSIISRTTIISQPPAADAVLNAIETDYEATHDVDLSITAVGTGIAIQQAQNGDADIVLVHAPSVEKTFLEGGYGVNRKIIAYNFFTIVGPVDDPAQITGKNALTLFNMSYGQNMPDQSGSQIWVSE